MTLSWSKVSGPGTVTFCAVSDGALTVSDDVTVTVNPAPGTGTGLTGRHYNDPVSRTRK
jgi:hypothetical protein